MKQDLGREKRRPGASWGEQNQHNRRFCMRRTTVRFQAGTELLCTKTSAWLMLVAIEPEADGFGMAAWKQ
jgi:hypothetical protein